MNKRINGHDIIETTEHKTLRNKKTLKKEKLSTSYQQSNIDETSGLNYTTNVYSMQEKFLQNKKIITRLVKKRPSCLGSNYFVQ